MENLTANREGGQRTDDFAYRMMKPPSMEMD
jgi:hypothetical protein